MFNRIGEGFYIKNTYIVFIFRNNSVSPINQLLACLRFFATGNHQSGIADVSGTHVSTICRIVKRVSSAIVTIIPQFIKMPTAQEIIHTQLNFYNIARFPKVIGIVDGTHIRIQSPGKQTVITIFIYFIYLISLLL